jgi:hypothetical protein
MVEETLANQVDLVDLAVVVRMVVIQDLAQAVKEVMLDILSVDMLGQVAVVLVHQDLMLMAVGQMVVQVFLG